MVQKYIGLARVSTVRQGASRLGIESGLEDIHHYINACGGELVQILEEVGSGTRARLIDRPVLLKALTLCKRHKAILLVPKVDRLVRSTDVHTDIKRSGVSFRACDMPEANEFTLDIMVAMAAQEARAIKKRTKDALAIYKRDKRVSKRVMLIYNNNPPPDVVAATAGKLGSLLVGCHLTDEGRARGRATANGRKTQAAIEVYADLLPDMERQAAEGKSLNSIAKGLNEAGYRTRNNALWTATQVGRALARAKGKTA
jgi:DNA invertase Pin-like site-specific DNA recombinase